ncbi:MAG: ImmA/IrrE family metallo-endopeptidase [Gammaproteobacteria bacterium AqS3]|nr:ImmA/IrrE family metallo-endopeptidase [Gammaproteobacteria bacterium AqS3]
MAIKVNPEILIWARATAALSVEEAAPKLGLTSSKRSTAADKLKALEAGEKLPTTNQLEDMARVYRRPLTAFYLAAPPRPAPRGQDFRQTPDRHTPRENALLDALLRDVSVRQSTVRDLLEDDEDFEAPDFVGSITLAQGVKHAVSAIAEGLGFDHTDAMLRRGNADDLFRRLRTAVQDAGVFVLILGDLGSHHTAIPAKVFRGFSMADDIAPFVVINGRDARPARAFTLIHELTHIWLGQTGVSDSVSIADPKNENAQIERFCDDVAGEFLLPGRRFMQGVASFDGGDVEAARSATEKIARRWSVSEPMVAYRLKRTGDLTSDTYNALHREYAGRWNAKLERDRRNREERKSKGPSTHVVKTFNLGEALMQLVHRTVRENTLSHTKAAMVLGSNPGSVEPLLRNFEDKRSSFVSEIESGN